MRINHFQDKIQVGLAVVAIVVMSAVFAPPSVLFVQGLQEANLSDADNPSQDDTEPVACTDYEYSDWSLCSASGVQKQSVISSSPSGCVGGTPPITSRPCTYVPPEDASSDTTKQITTTKITTDTALFARISDVLNAIVPFIVGLAILVILWGILGYISHVGEEEKRAEAKQFIVWSIIGLFFMLSIWGFVNVLVHSFELDTDIPLGAISPSLPCIPTPTTPCS